jgi:hypothetical protein
MLNGRSGPGGWIVALELVAMATRTTTRSANTSTTLDLGKQVAIEATTRAQANQDRNRGSNVGSVGSVGSVRYGRLGKFFSQLHRVIASVKHE